MISPPPKKKTVTPLKTATTPTSTIPMVTKMTPMTIGRGTTGVVSKLGTPKMLTSMLMQ